MQFNYIARDKNGKEVTGTLEATSKLEAADKLFNERHLNVVSLEQADKAKEKDSEETEKAEVLKKSTNPKKVSVEKELKPKNILDSINEYLASQTKVKSSDKAVAFRLIAVMINAGLSIVKALKVLAKQKVEGGMSFSESLGEYEDVFSEAEIGMVEAGEASGQLNKTLLSLASETEKSASLSKKIRSAMIYPVVVISIVIVAIFLMMIMVIPKLEELFTSAGSELPFLTRTLVNVSNWFMASSLFIPNWLLLIFLMSG